MFQSELMPSSKIQQLAMVLKYYPTVILMAPGLERSLQLVRQQELDLALF